MIRPSRGFTSLDGRRALSLLRNARIADALAAWLLVGVLIGGLAAVARRVLADHLTDATWPPDFETCNNPGDTASDRP
jgi:hypothetical protein